MNGSREHSCKRLWQQNKTDGPGNNHTFSVKLAGPLVLSTMELIICILGEFLWGFPCFHSSSSLFSCWYSSFSFPWLMLVPYTSRRSFSSRDVIEENVDAFLPCHLLGWLRTSFLAWAKLGIRRIQNIWCPPTRISTSECNITFNSWMKRASGNTCKRNWIRILVPENQKKITRNGNSKSCPNLHIVCSQQRILQTSLILA